MIDDIFDDISGKKEKDTYICKFETLNVTATTISKIITRRMRVHDGWILQTILVDSDQNGNSLNDSIVDVKMTYIYDPHHVWRLG